jgi:hypothetical protein
LKVYESSYCTFAVPDDWEAKPPFAFVGKDGTGTLWTAQVLERCLVAALPAASHLQQQKTILPRLYRGFELLAEGPHRPEGAGEGFALTFRFLDAEENESEARAFFIVLGPLMCQLVLAGPDRPDKDRERLFTAIARTFAFRQVDFLAKAQTAPLTSEVLRTPQPVAARGWPGGWRKFPRACVSLPLPSGWEVTEEDGDALFRRGTAEIRLHRVLEGHGDAGTWFSHRLKRLQTSGDLLVGSENGELDRGSYAALLYEEKGVGRTWKTTATNRCFEVYLDDRQPLLWSLNAAESGFADQRALFESLIAAAEFLDPEEWETRLKEPWIDYTLRGPWQVEAAGLYSNVTDPAPLFVHLNTERATFTLGKLEPSILESLRQGFHFQDGFAERSSLGVWRQHEALHYAVDGCETGSGRGVSVRATWLAKEHRMYGIFVRGAAASPCEALSRGILEAFQAPC